MIFRLDGMPPLGRTGTIARVVDDGGPDGCVVDLLPPVRPVGNAAGIFIRTVDVIEQLEYVRSIYGKGFLSRATERTLDRAKRRKESQCNAS